MAGQRNLHGAEQPDLHGPGQWNLHDAEQQDLHGPGRWNLHDAGQWNLHGAEQLRGQGAGQLKGTTLSMGPNNETESSAVTKGFPKARF